MNVLIGSNGGLTGIYLAKEFRKHDEIHLIGADSSIDNAGRFFVEEQCVLPDATSGLFISKLIELLNKKKIDIYIPTHSHEIRTVSYHDDDIKQNCSARFLVSPAKTFAELEDKRIANKNLMKIGVPVPAIIENDSCEYPIIMKKNLGSGSNGTITIENKEIHNAYKKTLDDVSFYQKKRGKEYTLDCMYDEEGNLIGYNQRERLKTIGGAVSITKNCDQFDIWPWISIISNKWFFRGCVNFQYIISDNLPYFIDINLRFPSGGLPLTVASGLDIPQLMLDIMMERPVKPFKLQPEFKNMKMYRFFEEIYEI